MDLQILELTLSDVEEVALIHTTVWQRAYRGILPEAFLDGISLERRIKLRRRICLGDAQSRINLVAKVDGVTAAFCDGGVNRDSGIDSEAEIYAIYVLDKYQGMGVGSRLFNSLVQRFRERSHRSICLWVLRDNVVARRFYEHKNGRIVGEKMICLDGVEYPELCYLFAIT